MKKEAKQDEIKNKKEESKTESLNFKCEQFFGKNWKYIFFFIAISVLVIAYEIHSINSRMTDLEQTVAENNGKVVMTTIDGRAIKVTKEPLKAELLKQFVASSLVNNLVISRSILTNDFSRLAYKDYPELLSSVQVLGFFYKNFINSEGEERDKQAIGDYIAYLQWLLSAIAQDKLPEFISIKNYNIDNYQYDNSKFTIEISIKVVAQSYIIAKDSYNTQQGIFKIYAEGSFDLTKSADTNPYGMRVHRLIITPLTKNKEGL